MCTVYCLCNHMSPTLVNSANNENLAEIKEEQLELAGISVFHRVEHDDFC